MRTRVIPAQITTVEDRIAGNLSLKQILILLSSVFLATGMYALVPPSMLITWYKLTISLVVFLTLLTLSIRVKGTIIADWLITLLKYQLRPRYYVFDKNEIYLRHIPYETKAQQERAVKQKEHTATQHEVIELQLEDLLRFNTRIEKENLDMRFTTSKKGGLNVAFEKVR